MTVVCFPMFYNIWNTLRSFNVTQLLVPPRPRTRYSLAIVGFLGLFYVLCFYRNFVINKDKYI